MACHGGGSGRGIGGSNGGGRDGGVGDGGSSGGSGDGPSGERTAKKCIFIYFDSSEPAIKSNVKANKKHVNGGIKRVG